MRADTDDNRDRFAILSASHFARNSLHADVQAGTQTLHGAIR